MAYRYEFTINDHTLNAILRGPGGPVDADLRRRGNRVLTAARQGAPVRTGALRGSLHLTMAQIGGEPAAVVGTNLEYALYVHEGTGPHTIRGNPLLVFRGRSGEMVFARQVRHPGTRPNPFLRNALDAAR